MNINDITDKIDLFKATLPHICWFYVYFKMNCHQNIQLHRSFISI